MEKISKEQIEQNAHRQAYTLFVKLIENQPNLCAAVTPSANNGGFVGAHLNAIYDQLVVLSRKNVQAEYGVS